MSDIRQWLGALGLTQYGDAFEANDIDLSLLPDLNDQVLKDIGVTSAGHRLRLLAAARAAGAKSVTVDQDDARPSHPEEPSLELVTGQFPSGERRQLTVMFCDLVGSTALSEKLDPEELRALLHNYRTRCGEVIQRYDGFVARYVGDGILTYFGWPTAHEDDAERAIRAALEISQTVKQASITETLSVRIGIATGPVVVGEQAGVGDQSKLAIGSTPNLAARLQGLASADQIVIASSTRRLIGNAFELTDLGEHELKGISEAVHAWRVVAVGEAASRFEASRGDQLTPLVGREQEIGLLLDRWELARAGEGQVVLLSGEPGIGKSRMLRAFRERLGEGIDIALQYQCSPYYTNTALYPIIDHLERGLGFQRGESNEQKLDKLEQRLIKQLGGNPTQCYLIGELLSLSCEVRYGKLNLSPQRQKDDTLHALTEIIAVIANQQATVVLFEDLHWADPTTLEVLNILIDRTESLPVLVLLAYRPEFQPPWLARAHVTPVGVTRLSRKQSASIVLRVAGGKPLPSDLVAQIVDKTDGVPLFLEELSKAVLESDMLLDKGDRYDYSGSVSKMAIPATLHDSLMARLDRLIPVKEVAQVGAALGREFSYELLSAVAPMQEPDLTAALNKLVQSELVFRRGAPPNQTYVFKHALVQDAAYDSMLKSKRQQLHAQIAEAIRQRFPHQAETEPELLAHHYTAAGRHQASIPYWQQAGELAQKRVALPEAIHHFKQGLVNVSLLPKSIERDRHELELRALLGMAIVYMHGYAHPKVFETLEPALHLDQSSDGGHYTLRILWGLWVYELCTGRVEASLPRAETLLGVSEQRNDDAMRIVGHWAAANSYYFLGKFKDSFRHCEGILSRYKSDRDRHIADIVNHDPKTIALAYAAACQWALGFPDRALASAREAIANAQARAHAFDICWVHAFTTFWIFKQTGDQASVEASLEQGLKLASEQGLVFFSQLWYPITRADLFHQSGRVAEACSLFKDGIPRWLEMGFVIGAPTNKTSYAECLITCGDVNSALLLVNESLEQIERTNWGERIWLSNVLRVKALALEASGKVDQAEATFLEALNVAREQGAKSWELRAAMSLARLWSQQGKHKEALELLKPVYDWFTEGFDTKDLKEAKDLLEELA